MEAQDFRKKIFTVEKQRERLGVQLSSANVKYFQALEEVGKRDERLAEINRQIADVQAKLAQQKNLYDAVVADRNLYSRNLISANEEISEMDGNFKRIYHTLEQLKDEVRQKDQELVKEHFEHQKFGTVLSLETLEEFLEDVRYCLIRW